MSVRIEKGHSNELLIWFLYSQERIDKIKLIKGRKLNPELKRWVIPDTEEALLSLYEYFNDEEITFVKPADLCLKPTAFWRTV